MNKITEYFWLFFKWCYSIIEYTFDDNSLKHFINKSETISAVTKKILKDSFFIISIEIRERENDVQGA